MQISTNNLSNQIIGKNPLFLQCLERARKVANSNSSVVISGESGTGKEVIAQYIHENSSRKVKPFVAINCSAIPETLIESELFGYTKGSFTGAYENRIGLFEAADSGTLFLDEIGEISLSAQAKILRVLQEKKIKRVGENKSKEIDCRIICATNKDLRKAVQEGHFRADLFFRLNVIPIQIPNLRTRKEDIIPLAEFFLKKYSLINNRFVNKLSEEVTRYLINHSWPGNVRELENFIERGVALCNKDVICSDDIDFEVTPTESPGDQSSLTAFTKYIESQKKILPLKKVSLAYIMYAISLNHGARDRTAKELGIDRKTLYRWLHDEELLKEDSPVADWMKGSWHH
jgi:two-component system, NtrC family, response regulator HydG